MIEDELREIEHAARRIIDEKYEEDMTPARNNCWIIIQKCKEIRKRLELV